MEQKADCFPLPRRITLFDMCAASARQNQYARVAPIECFLVEREPRFSDRVFDQLDISGGRPPHPVGIDFTPAKAVVTWFRVAEVVDIVTSVTKRRHDRRIMRVAPGRGDIDATAPLDGERVGIDDTLRKKGVIS